MKVGRLLWMLLRNEGKLYLLDAVLTIIGWALLTVPAFISQNFFNSLMGQRTIGVNTWSLVAILVAAQLARIAIILLNIIVDVTFRNLIGEILRTNMLNSALRRQSEHSFSAGEAVSRFREDVDDVTDFLSWSSLLDVVGAFIFAIIAVAVMIKINLLITVIVFFPLALVIIIANRVSKRVNSLRGHSRRTTGAVTNFIGEMFGAIQSIQINNKERNVINRFDTLNNERGKRILRENVFASLLNSIFTNIAEVGTGIILLLVAGLMKSGTFTVGNLTVFTYYLTWVTQLMKRFGTITARYKQLGVSFERMSDLIINGQEQDLISRKEEILPNLKVKTFESEGLILSDLKISNLTYCYPESGRGISDINLELSSGSLTVITGSAGSGKSTLIKSLLGILPKQSGRIYFNGEIVQDPGSFFIPPICGYSPQIPQLFSETLKENILLGLDEKTVDFNRAIYKAVMEEDVQQLAEGPNTLIGPRGIMLSGGQVLRTAAARVFIREPQLLVIDDLSSAIDANTERLLWDRILADKNNHTYLVASSHPEVIQQADKIIVLKKGQIIAQGKLNHLLETCDEIRKLFKLAT